MSNKYKYIGQAVKYKGKTLWEIVGNLRNFGIGRIVLKDTELHYPEASFYKIVKVQPLPLPEKEGRERQVMVWVDAVYRGKKEGVQLIKQESALAQFQLVPKSEETKYLNFEEINRVTVVPKYMPWPPIYKELWQRRNPGKTIPPLETVLQYMPHDIRQISTEETTENPASSNYFPSEAPVEELYKELARLRMLNNEVENDEEKFKNKDG